MSAGQQALNALKSRFTAPGKAGSSALRYTIGGAIIAVSLGSIATQSRFSEISAWADQMFGAVFLALLLALVSTSVYCWLRLRAEPGNRLWLQAGYQAANGITTLALTYTLLGISLGIGSLSGAALTPETIQGVIAGLTNRFSMAFLTTVIGLPLSAVLRALLSIEEARHASNPGEENGYV